MSIMLEFQQDTVVHVDGSSGFICQNDNNKSLFTIIVIKI